VNRREHRNSSLSLSLSLSFIWGLVGDFDAGTLCKDFIGKFYRENIQIYI
jgi:hypothetical protein